MLKPDQIINEVQVPAHVLSLESLTKLIDEIKVMVGQEIDSHDLESMGEYLQELSSRYMDLTNIVASAKYYKAVVGKLAYEELVVMIKEGELEKEYNGLVSSSAVKNYINDKYPDFVFMEEEALMVARSVDKRQAAIVTLISKEKEVYKHTMTGSRQK